MRRIRMESLEIDDIDTTTMALLDLIGPISMNVGTTEWSCGHCDEALLHLARDDYAAEIVFRCPHCHGFSRYREIQ